MVCKLIVLIVDKAELYEAGVISCGSKGGSIVDKEFNATEGKLREAPV